MVTEVTVLVEGTPEDVEAAVDAAIRRFEAFITEKSGSAPLISAEKAILKTFLIYAQQKRF
jgi:hypothetical protein